MQNSKTARGAGIPAGIWYLALAIVAGCGSSGGSATISSQPLSGKIGGQPWTLATAASNSTLSTADQFWVDAYSETFTPCSGSASLSADEIILTLPKTVGSYNLSINLNETFYIASTSDNFVATSGELVISEVTATTISGGANFAYNADNSVDGQFQATICP